MKVKIIIIFSVIFLLISCLCSCTPTTSEKDELSYITINDIKLDIPLNFSQFLSCINGEWQHVADEIIEPGNYADGNCRLNTEKGSALIPVKVYQSGKYTNNLNEMYISKITLNDSVNATFAKGITIGSSVTDILNAYQGYHTYLSDSLNEVNKENAIIECNIPEYNYTLIFHANFGKVTEIELIMNCIPTLNAENVS